MTPDQRARKRERQRKWVAAKYAANPEFRKAKLEYSKRRKQRLKALARRKQINWGMVMVKYQETLAAFLLAFVMAFIAGVILTGCSTSPKELECIVRDSTSHPCNW